ncbi:MAG TPA: hypothetical protein VM076_10000 [Gemmatimonadaceae bacterium]|nr:hypothetical protein [Gemmatimonadaceae bacterium]
MLGALLASAGVSASLLAQGTRSRRAELTAGGAPTYSNLVGGDFDGTKAAAGFEVNAGVAFRRWQLGLGYDRTTHGHEATKGDYVVSNAFFETRLLFPGATRSWTPYVGARVGRAMASFEGVLGLTDHATGFIGGVGAGLLWPVASHVQIDAAGFYDRLSHDYGTGDYSDAERGGRPIARVGVRVGSR